MLQSAPNANIETDPPPAKRKRPHPGERRLQILRVLSEMLEDPSPIRMTTSALAQRLGVSEAALYRHFASKAQMFEALIEFIETSMHGHLSEIAENEAPGPAHARRIVTATLQFGEKHPGMSRVMVGDALVYEHERLQQRMNQVFDKLETALRHGMRHMPDGEAHANAVTLTAFIMGRLQRFARSGFRNSPTERLDACLAILI
jgi:TetR/AcrR family transcriptional regulator